MDNQFMANLKKAKEANDVRQQKLAEDFNDDVWNTANQMGCDSSCIHDARQDGKCPAEIISECCKNAAIQVDFANVDIAAISERQYGDLEKLNNEQVEEINSSITSLFYSERRVIYKNINGTEYHMFYYWNINQSIQWNEDKIHAHW
jgi:hypothetical protein